MPQPPELDPAAAKVPEALWHLLCRLDPMPSALLELHARTSSLSFRGCPCSVLDRGQGCMLLLVPVSPGPVPTTPQTLPSATATHAPCPRHIFLAGCTDLSPTVWKQSKRSLSEGIQQDTAAAPTPVAGHAQPPPLSLGRSQVQHGPPQIHPTPCHGAPESCDSGVTSLAEMGNNAHHARSLLPWALVSPVLPATPRAQLLPGRSSGEGLSVLRRKAALLPRSLLGPSPPVSMMAPRLPDRLARPREAPGPAPASSRAPLQNNESQAFGAGTLEHRRALCSKLQRQTCISLPLQSGTQDPWPLGVGVPMCCRGGLTPGSDPKFVKVNSSRL